MVAGTLKNEGLRENFSLKGKTQKKRGFRHNVLGQKDFFPCLAGGEILISSGGRNQKNDGLSVGPSKAML